MTPEAILLEIPCVIKAQKVDASGKRMVSVEASNESSDEEGDVILQSALLNSADSFIKHGVVDIDHYAFIGDRIGIPNPSSYIVGRPTKVVDLGDKRTGVHIEIMRSSDGVHDPKKNKYDEFWDTLQTDPITPWRSSIFGYPIDGMVDNCRETVCDKGAKRFLVRGINWTGLAFTKSPVNQDIRGHAKIISAKAHIRALHKSYWSGPEPMGMAITPSHGVAGPVIDSGDINMPPMVSPAATGPTMMIPMSMDEAIGQYHRHMSKDCPFTMGENTRLGFEQHFMACCGCGKDHADTLAHALMYYCLLERDRNRKG